MQKALGYLKSILNTEMTWWILIVAGIALRLRQYLVARSLWADEASLALNLVTRTFAGLTQPLDYHQAAPIGFLFIEKLAVIIFGNNEYSLRLFPLLSSVAAAFLIYRIAREYLGLAGMLAVALFALNSWLISYSVELKQYSSDVMVTLLLVHLSARCFKERAGTGEFLWVGIAGIVTMWISHVAIFVLAGIGMALAVGKFIERRDIPVFWILGLGAAWLISFGVEYLVVLKYTASDEYFLTTWQRAFLPLPPWSDVHWFVITYYRFLLIVMNRTDPFFFYLMPALTLIGSLTLLARKRNIALVIILIFITTLIASALQKYPLTYRFMLFLIPLTLLLMTEAVRSLHSFVAKWQPGIALALSGIPVAVMLWSSILSACQGFIAPPIVSDIRPAVEYVGENRTPEDIIYVYYGAAPSFLYYAPSHDLVSGNIIIIPEEPRKKVALKNFLADVDGLKGNGRVWFIFSDIVDCAGCEGDPRQFFVDYLDEFGVMLDRVEATGSGAYLYDLSP